MAGRVGGHDGPGRRARRARSAGTAGRFGGTAGLVGGHGGPGRGAPRAGSAGLAGRVGGHGGPDGAGRAGRSGQGGAAGARGAGRVGQDRAGPGRSSCERTHEWFLEMCAFGAGTWDKISKKFRHIGTILELCDNFRLSATVLDKKSYNFVLNRFRF